MSDVLDSYNNPGDLYVSVGGVILRHAPDEGQRSEFRTGSIGSIEEQVLQIVGELAADYDKWAGRSSFAQSDLHYFSSLRERDCQFKAFSVRHQQNLLEFAE